MIQKYSMKCDKCGKASEEFYGWPACRLCLQSFCPDCRRVALDDESDGSTVCKDCLPIRVSDVD